ncbi:MAG: tRNA (adenosine(37)-N6)-threonylcarbamoyltransferase complex dimerization subunit type 1 TsaB [Bacilli bacterium]|jgi:tRNA threonylcarbamoyladenosine biosynthesis protein TsaB|nr:tRNA (adenosine(37)-N6)-threonylcarbamoyltransferase complex dimerization subunit type 1 TsaB [Bacilli bacterium]
MNYFFIDTTNEILSLAIANDNHILASNSYYAVGEHSRYAMIGIEEIFNKTKLNPQDIDKLIVVNGPGSWTGIRIGVTIGKVYAWALNKEIISVSSLHAYALSFSNYDYYIVAINARRNHVYAGIYDKNYNNVLDDCYININELNKKIDQLDGSIIIIGNIKINEKYKTVPVKLDIKAVINYYKNKSSNNYEQLKPKYLKKTEAEEKL